METRYGVSSARRWKDGVLKEHRDEGVFDPNKRSQEEVKKNQGNMQSVLVTDIPLRARRSSGMVR